MLRFICGVVLVHFALGAPMESVIQRHGIMAKRKVCGPGKGDVVYGCTQFEALGYCKKSSLYHNYVTQNCGASCGLCEAAPTPAPTAVSVTVTSLACVGAHNTKRNQHKDTPALSWNSNLARGSESWAIHLADINTDTNNINLIHSESSGNYGENIYYSGSSRNTVKTCSDAVTPWYDEERYYDWNNPGNSNTARKAIGHFTQVVWKSTTEVGCGVAKIVLGFFTLTFVVCRYSPAGNVSGQYGDNVKALKNPAAV